MPITKNTPDKKDMYSIVRMCVSHVKHPGARYSNNTWKQKDNWKKPPSFVEVQALKQADLIRPA